MNFIIEPEYIACILLTVLIGYSYPNSSFATPSEKVFRAALLVSVFAILSNIYGIYTIEFAAHLPYWLKASANALYFFATDCMTVSIAFAILFQMFEDRSPSRRLRAATIALFVGLAICLALSIANFWTGWLFSFDAQDQYIRGPLNKSTFAMVLYCAVLIGVYYARERRSLRRTLRTIVFVLPMLSILIALIQFVSPDTMMSGTAAALSLLVLFIYGQQQHLHIDRLTDLTNRDMFYHILEQRVAKGVPFRLIVISLRNYKSVNNRHGQRKGDEFLQALSQYLLTFDRKRVIACRFTGVKFTLIVSDMTENEYEALFSSICRRFDEPFYAMDTPEQLSASIADVAFPEHAGSVELLIASLEYAIRLSKLREDGAPVRFSKHLRSEYGRRVYLTEQLNDAFADDRYLLRFQPIIDAVTEAPVGAEVLIRMREASGGIIMPGEFIPLADETGVTTRIGWLVLEKAARFLAEHRGEGIPWLSVNISGEQYEREESVRRVCSVLSRYDIAPEQIKLEITEGKLIHDIEKARAIIHQLRDMGIGVCLDDFGTGYSNLVNVLMLPVEFVKLDRSFVLGVENDPSAYRLLETMVNGLSAMHLKTLAEGVETTGQRHIVRNMGVDMIQGFHYARPMDGDAFLAYLRDHASHGPNA